MWFLAAVVILAVPVVLALAGAGDEPDNALVQVQQGEPWKAPDDVLAVAARVPVLTITDVASEWAA